MGEALGIPEDKLRGLAVACYTAIADGIELADNFCLRADPVSLVAASSRVFLMGPAGYQLNTNERERLQQSFNQQFAADGLQFIFPNKQRWYILLAPGVNAEELLPAPRSLLGENIAAAVSKLGKFWQQSFTEAQMLLHADPIRQQHQSSGIPPLSGLWFWGGGYLDSSLAGLGSEVECFGSSSLLQGLAQTTGAKWQQSVAPGSANRQVIHWCAEQSGTAIEQLQELEKFIFQPLLKALTTGATLHLHSSDAGCWKIKKSIRWPWRSSTALAAIDKRVR